MQVGEKERTKKREYQGQMYELRAAKLAEIEYSRKISEDNFRNKNMVRDKC
jgi:hypothetical protein